MPKLRIDERKRSYHLQVRLTAEQGEVVEALAARLGRSIGDTAGLLLAERIAQIQTAR
jgi:transcriptional antiterminator Rof (Rho-off)